MGDQVSGLAWFYCDLLTCQDYDSELKRMLGAYVVRGLQHSAIVHKGVYRKCCMALCCTAELALPISHEARGGAIGVGLAAAHGFHQIVHAGRRHTYQNAPGQFGA